MTTEYESELTGSRAEIAAVLSGVVDGLLTGSIRLGEGSDAVTVAAPDDVALEIELETEDDELSLELELEWADATVASEEVSGDTDEGLPSKADEAGDTATDGNVSVETAEDDPAAHVGAADMSQSLARFEVFRDRSDEWRWRLRHRNGNVIATSGEGYTQKHNAWKGLRSVVKNAPGAELTEESGPE